MEKDYFGSEEKEQQYMKHRMDRAEINKYGRDPYKSNILKRGNYNYASLEELQKAQAECEKTLKEVLGQMSKLQDTVSELVEVQTRIREAIYINSPQTRVDKDKQVVDDRDEER